MSFQLQYREQQTIFIEKCLGNVDAGSFRGIYGKSECHVVSSKSHDDDDDDDDDERAVAKGREQGKQGLEEKQQHQYAESCVEKSVPCLKNT